MAIHLLLGVVLANWRFLSTWWGVGAFFWFFTQTLRTRNRRGIAHLGAAYIVGMEVLLRMCKATLFWEFGKLACIALLGVALLIEPRKDVRWRYLVVVVLLVPALFLATDLDPVRYRQMITFQLGGMVLLVVSGMYFGGRLMTRLAVQDMFRNVLLPIASMLTYLFLKTPSLAKIEFALGSNFVTSGGFGPNQVSTILGLGIFIILLNYLLKWPWLFSNVVDKLLVTLFSFRGLLTYSRGGLFAALIALICSYFVYIYFEQNVSKIKIYLRLIIGSLIFVTTFIVTDNLTGNLLSARFRGETYGTLKSHRFDINEATSHRTEIMLTDLKMWLDHLFFGVGLGRSNVLRPEYGIENNTHTEQTRLLAEHGLLGFFVLIWIVVQMIVYSARGTPAKRFIATGFMILSFITMLHAATRLAMVGFVFGLGFIYLYEECPLHRQSPFSQRQLPLRS